jgi:ketosteroid isomerase-like protein
MNEAAAVEFANDAFYVAFAGGDVEAMAELWSRTAAVTCIHPGWAPLFGRAAVMESWAAILGSPQRPDIRARGPNVRVQGEVAYVVCHEVIRQSFLVATNIFLREGGEWKMIHHQAGTAPPPVAAAEPAPKLQ